jgi:hypothetical protein
VGVGCQPCLGSGKVLHHIDADGGPTEPGLDDVGPVEGGWLGAFHQQGPGQGGQSGRGHERTEGQLVHSKGRTGHGRPGVADAGHVQGGLEGSVLPRSPVTAHQGGIDVEGPAPAQATSRLGEPPVGRGDQLETSSTPRHTVHEGVGLQPGIDFVPVTGLRPEQGPDAADVAIGSRKQAPRGLEAGEHTHVVLGRRTSKDDG